MSEYTIMPDYRTEFEPSPRWVRVYFNSRLIADSRKMMLLRETNHLPLYYFPKNDVRMDCLHPSDHTAHSDLKGEGIFWHVQVGDKIANNAAFTFRNPPDNGPKLKDYVAFQCFTVADTKRPWLLFETGLPTRYYMPKHDVRMDLLEHSDTVTRCPYKGEANHYSV